MYRNIVTGRIEARTRLLCCLFSAIVLLLLSAGESKAASTPQASQAGGDADYVGSETCKTCHEESYQRWKNTVMGRAMLEHPKNDLEKRGCESCHDPGKAHVEGGGDINAIKRFDKKSPLSAAEKNAQCLQCHDKGNRMFWRRGHHESRG